MDTPQLIEKQIEALLQLGLQDRIYVYQTLWQSILKDIQVEEAPLTDQQKKEVDRRLERIERGEVKLFSWQEVKQEIKASL